MTRDHEFFVCRDDEKSDPALRLRYERFSFCICPRVKANAKPGELLRYTGANVCRVLADSGSEHKRIEAAERRRQHSSIETDPIDKVVDRKCGARCITPFQLSHIVTDTGQSFEAALPVE